MVHSRDYFQESSQTFCVVVLRVRLFRMALSWQVVCAACCHMALVFVNMHLYNIFTLYPFQKQPKIFNLVLIN